MYDVEEFWIINWEGIPLYNYSPTSKLEPSLISGFFSAIQAFAKEIDDSEEVNSIVFGKYNYTFLSDANRSLYFISKSLKKVKIKEINKHLINIQKMFVYEFSNDIEFFDGEISVFEKFNEVFNKYFEDNFKKLKNIW
jgi:hypothetical protein